MKTRFVVIDGDTYDTISLTNLTLEAANSSFMMSRTDVESDTEAMKLLKDFNAKRPSISISLTEISEF